MIYAFVDLYIDIKHLSLLNYRLNNIWFIFVDIALLYNDDEAYELLNSLESFMNNQNDEDELISITSSDGCNDKFVEDATKSFLDAALTGNVELLTTLYKSGAKVLLLTHMLKQNQCNDDINFCV